MELEPPDFLRCQALIREGSFMTLGPRRFHQCEAIPVFIAVEIHPGKDGLRGSMSLCPSCAGVMLRDPDLNARVQLQPIHHKEGI